MDVASLLEMITGGGSEAAVGVTPRLTKRTNNLPQQQYDKTKKAIKSGPSPEEYREWLLAEKANLPEIHQMSDDEIMGMSDEEILQFAPDWVGTERPAANPADPNAFMDALVGMIAEGKAGPSIHPLDDPGSMRNPAEAAMYPGMADGDLMNRDALSYLMGMGGTGELTPAIKATKSGEPMAANTSLQSQLLKTILGITGKDPDLMETDSAPYNGKDDPPEPKKSRKKKPKDEDDE